MPVVRAYNILLLNFSREASSTICSTGALQVRLDRHELEATVRQFNRRTVLGPDSLPMAGCVGGGLYFGAARPPAVHQLFVSNQCNLAERTQCNAWLCPMHQENDGERFERRARKKHRRWSALFRAIALHIEGPSLQGTVASPARLP